MESSNRTKLMWASFLTLVASGMGFAVRTAMGGIWGAQFDIGPQQFGAIMGAGFLGFGMMIFFGGILVEKFGYKKLLILAFLLHFISGLMLFIPRFSPGNAYNMLFYSVFLFSIAQGLYEAVINPLIAQIYPENKTHYLNILHAGWPGGMIIGGLLAACTVGDNAWIVNISYWELPLASFMLLLFAYAALAFPEKFPDTVGEKKAGNWGVIFSCFASPIFIVLIFLHACIGYVELGVDSWTTKLMENLLENSILILVYTSFLMFILRFFAGPIVHKINPIGLLLLSSIIGFLGLRWLGSDIDSIAMIFVAATFYSLGKAFFWPTMLGVAGERYPQCGSVAMGAMGAAGMLTVGLIAGEAIGYKQASNASAKLQETKATFDRYSASEEKGYLFLPKYDGLAANLVATANGTKKKDNAAADSEMNPSGFFLLFDPDLFSMSNKKPDEFKAKMARPNATIVKEYRDVLGGIKSEDAFYERFVKDEAAVEKRQKAFEKAEKAGSSKKEDRLAKLIAEKEQILKCVENASVDVPVVQAAELHGGRRALSITSYVPAIMAIGFLLLLIYYQSTGGYKVLHVAEDGSIVEVGSHDDSGKPKDK